MPSESSVTLPPMDHAARRDRLRRSLPDAGCEVLVVLDPADIRYLTGFSGTSASLLVGAVADEDVLVSDLRYRERVAELDVARVELDRRLGAVIADMGPRPVGVDVDHTSLAQAMQLEDARSEEPVVRTRGLVALLRAVKDEAEIARLRFACGITSEVLGELCSTGLRPGITERGLARLVEDAFIERGADGAAFPTIVASGVNGASAHHGAGDRTLMVGDLVTIDCGAEVDGYRADMTRTLPVGDPTRVAPQLREAHGIVEAANAAGRTAAHVGVSIADIDRAARRVVTDAGFGPAFLHPTGHGIGLDVHEAPLVHEQATGSLRSGTAFTVEPGIYLPGVGGVRIEDSLIVLEEVVHVMTELGRGLAPA